MIKRLNFYEDYCDLSKRAGNEVSSVMFGDSYYSNLKLNPNHLFNGYKFINGDIFHNIMNSTVANKNNLNMNSNSVIVLRCNNGLFVTELSWFKDLKLTYYCIPIHMCNCHWAMVDTTLLHYIFPNRKIMTTTYILKNIEDEITDLAENTKRNSIFTLRCWWQNIVVFMSRKETVWLNKISILDQRIWILKLFAIKD